MASSSSCGHNKTYAYDAFLSFCGEDTRKTFVDHLYVALDRQGICTFKDDERLRKGKRINDELLQAIEESRLHIIVFSRNYATSSWCLNELLKIMECHKKNEHTVFPVFYDVDPSEVRKQSGSVGEAFAKHKNNNNESEVGKWREALEEAANLSGWDLKKTADGHEAKLIKLIIEKVSLELRSIDMNLDETLVGMEQRMQDLDSCLEIGSIDVRMIGIKGMGGAGKTTLARAIFDKISFNFEGKSFVENVREKASRGLEKLQEQVLRDVLKNKDITVSDVHEGKKLMRKALRGKKVLVVLDDVDHKDQLEMLAGDTDWFERGSRIIITTREGQVLEAHRVKWIHDVNLLSEEEAICLFRRHAFGKNIPTREYEKQSREVVSYADGLPLTIKVLGSKLCGKDDSEWRDALKRLKTIPLKETLKILELSYESLEDDCKEIFLDVACFLRGWQKEDAIGMLESCGFYAKDGLKVLEQKSLITLEDIYGSTTINMHDHLVEMGKNIVRRGHQDEPHKHSRLWDQEEIEQVLADNSGSEAVRCIYLLNITSGILLEGLENFKKLRCLIVDNRVKIDEARIHFPNSLRYLNWCKYPHWCLPKTFEANNLVALEMPFSEIEQLWEGGKLIMKKLTFLDLSCTKLRSLDLGLMPILERLNLRSCIDFVELCEGGKLIMKKLTFLDLSCTKLRSLDLGLMPILERLNLEFCKDLVELWEGGKLIMKKLTFLDLSCTKLRSLDLGLMPILERLNLEGCIDLVELWEGGKLIMKNLRFLNLSGTKLRSLDLGLMPILEDLDLRGCTDLVELWEGGKLIMKNLRFLNLRSSTKLRSLDLGLMPILEDLDLQGCTDLVELWEGGKLIMKKLKFLNLRGTKLRSLDLGLMPILESLDLECCKDLVELWEGGKLIMKNLRFLNLSGTKLRSLDLGLMPILEDLDLRGCTDLVELWEGGKLIMKNLRFLNLRSSTKLRSLDLGLMPILEDLDLQGCTDLVELWEGGKLIMKKLTFLNLSYTKLRSLDLGLMPILERLDLQYCEDLVEPDVHGGCLKSLVNLNLSGCSSLKSISFIELFESLEVVDIMTGHSNNSLQHLYLSSTGIEEAPSSIGNLHKLVSLHLENCKSLKSLPGSICNLQHLRSLKLFSSGIEELPDDLGQLESLEVLDLSDCENIRDIPRSICMLKHLKELNLQGCKRLEKLPEELGDLKCLKLLFILGTGITHLPQSVSLLRGLKIDK